MALMDEFKEEREAIKNGTFKQKATYFWDYYKWYVIVPAVIILFVGATIYQVVTSPEIALNGILLNAHNIEAENNVTELSNDFAKEKNIDLKEYDIQLSTNLSYVINTEGTTANYETLQVLMTWIAAGNIDFINGDKAAMIDLAYKGHLEDLNEVLTEEQLKEYEPYFLYIDQAVVGKMKESLDSTEDSSEIEIPDCTKPELMEDPVPILIDLSSSSKLAEIYGDTEGGFALGIAVNAPHIETTLEFIGYLVEE